MKAKYEPDYIALQKILQDDLGQQVSMQQARKVGEWILRFYSHLQDEDTEDVNTDSS